MDYDADNRGYDSRSVPYWSDRHPNLPNKNDFLDAEAIAEAVTKQNMRFVQLKTQEQLDWQAMHRVRDRLVQRRTALINRSTVVGAGDQESPEAFRITAKEGGAELPARLLLLLLLVLRLLLTE